MSEIITNSELEEVVGGKGGFDHATGAYENYGNYIVYTINADDFLYSIGLRFGVSAAQIAVWNNIENPDLVYPGQKLIIYPTILR